MLYNIKRTRRTAASPVNPGNRQQQYSRWREKRVNKRDTKWSPSWCAYVFFLCFVYISYTAAVLPTAAYRTFEVQEYHIIHTYYMYSSIYCVVLSVCVQHLYISFTFFNWLLFRYIHEYRAYSYVHVVSSTGHTWWWWSWYQDKRRTTCNT